MTDLASPDTTDEEFVAQCEADYTIAEITSLAHVAPGATSAAMPAEGGQPPSHQA